MRNQTAVLLACVFLCGCAASDLGYVEKPKYDALQQELTKAQDDLKTAQSVVAECQAHKYQVYTQAYRTWRLDTITGETCLLLAPTSDWKKPDTEAQSCSHAP